MNEILRKLGLRVVRFGNDEVVGNLLTVVENIKACL
ncbi:MAG: DUF559 domain-containing protein [Chloroflexi bacterium CFX2]|nr:DUF559 domain-containing protein [Chloroflexi bacterium CFX2]